MNKNEFSFVASDQSRQNLSRLVDMWIEVAAMSCKMGDLGRGAMYRDCANDLKAILSGDSSPVERFDDE